MSPKTADLIVFGQAAAAEESGYGNTRATNRSVDQWLAVVLLLFIGSGCAALIYEIVWFQMLELFVGSSSVSMAVLLGTFMGGMCLGSFLFPRIISPAQYPLRVYVLLEFWIGAIALVLFVVMPLVGRVYTSWGGYGVTGYLVRGVVAAICLLPPTLAMGATLPAVARWVKATRSGVSWLGFFYAGNIVGGVLGCLLAGFYLLRVYNFNVVKNPKTEVIIDDGRHYLLTTREKFDGITSDPLDPWVKGTATLYTKEFFELAKSKLKPGGVLTVWMPLYENSPAAVKSGIASFFEVFPYGTIWGNTKNGEGCDTVLLGTLELPHFNVDDVENRLDQPEYAAVKKPHEDIGKYSAAELFATYAGRASDLKEYLTDAEINRDRNLRLQYLAGLGMNLYQYGTIYADILKYQRFPDDLFSGSEETLTHLRSAVENAPGRRP